MSEETTELTGSLTWCKICGITSMEDALAVQHAGADALGFVCHTQSPRFVEAELIADISADIEITRVALFVDADAAKVEQILKIADIDLLQFHGNEAEEFCNGFGLPYMKALRMRDDADVTAHAQSYASAWALLLDAYVPGQPGGTGISFDWQLWPQKSDQRLVLAGGLTPSNVAKAVCELNPFGVDVSGGVEGGIKGRKDHHKIEEFIQEVRRVGSKQGQ